MKTHFISADYGYKTAVNFDGTNYYNAPATISVDSPKCLTRNKYILPVGQTDSINTWSNKDVVYVLSKNRGLGYIGLTCIDVLTGAVADYYLDNVDDSVFDYSNKKIATHILNNF